MDDNKKDYSDFFKSQNNNSENDNDAMNRREVGQGDQHDPNKERPSYYYSYGPYKSAFNDNHEQEALVTSASGTEGTSSVEVTPPKNLRPFSFGPDNGSSQGGGHWDPQSRRRTSVKSVFAAFLAGALVVGGLMFSADKMNLFTGNQPLASSSTATATAKSSSDNGDVKNVALDVVRPGNISAIAQNAGPAIVKVEALVKPKQTSRGGNSLFDDPFFRQFFGDNGGTVPKSNQQDSSNGELQPAGMGTGFIFEKTGYILTNEHVVDGADEVQITVEGYDKPFKAKLLGNSYDLDLAVLKIEGDKDFPILPLGKAEDVNVGDWVVAIGNPYGFDHTVTVGVLSAKERPISIPDSKGTREYKHLLQTDASINPGNSGGPLLNLNGEVIGINTAVSSQAQGIGFAIPTSTISSVLDNLKNNVEIPKEPVPYLGVGLQDIGKDWVSELKLSNTDGALVGSVQRKSPAFQAGLRQYDVIVDINGTKIKNSQELITKVQATKVGDKVTLGLIRDGKRMEVPVTVGDKNTLAETPAQ
ncbi:S1C family serine protease [Paenibacillus sp. GCM10023248]|uniref:S1C family serine protease n=1 Tax=Bacillales TaxID=1385 RepID=UPI002379EF68|nr:MULTISPECIES: trypsin-like peptidase domain-containing protein [Bacillales]MDD9266271.1 trypsin-like peptidase domain-containing protein [Paenibacillus sp. MAHUQ-63]MDR6878392.1 S1-C subfamily serine protease [Bacillus sp. 3255]